MHFDVIVEAKIQQEKAIEYGKQYLEDVGQGGQKMTQESVSSVISKKLPNK